MKTLDGLEIETRTEYLYYRPEGGHGSGIK